MSENDGTNNVSDDPLPSASMDTPESGISAPPDETQDELKKAFRSLGYGCRWYDQLYNALRFLQYSWLGRRLPASWRRRFYYMSNYLVQFHEVKRTLVTGGHRFDGPLNVPDDEHVSIPGLWVVEYFPPSLIDDLDRAIKSNHWDNRRHIGRGESSLETLKDSRQGSGPTWWRIADIASPGAGYSFPDGYREKLPKEFKAVELKGVPIGQGLTAVIAYFHLSESGYASVDKIWHQNHQPSLARTKGRLVVAEGARWTAFRKTQAARNELHSIARDWLKARCPGTFAQTGEHQPLMDLLLLSEFDPASEERPDRESNDRMRALGLTDSHVTWRTSTELPGLLLEQSREELAPGLRKRTWALWGKRGTVEAAADLRFYVSDVNGAIAHHVDSHMGDFVVRLGLSEFLDLLKAESATMRDSARAHHGKFSRRDLKRLRQRFLTASLDLSSIERDVKQYNSNRWRDREAWFVMDYAPWIRRQDDEAGRKPFKPIQVNKDLRKRQIKGVQDLVVADRSYREILSTVASLGASIDSFMVQRYAIWIAIGSAIVALVTLWFSLLKPDEASAIIEAWVTSILQ
ncbi:hypothetical protein ACIP9X_12095 [Arthrobacter sp. NPDC093125]|uniref:hypothetical protein n=1 Tax=Arthrobacter sp. NPDC093125 TaxID=3363944 RepID=UPI00382DC616